MARDRRSQADPAALAELDAVAASAQQGGTWDPLGEFFVTEGDIDESEAAYLAEVRKRGSLRSGGDVAELLCFWVADEEYALDIVEIQEIIKVPDITEVPRADPTVLGIISLRGTIVPVLDLRRVLHLPSDPMTRASRILVLRGGGDPIGLLVDRVTSVVRLQRDAIEPTPRAMKRESNELLRGVGRLGQRMLIVLDVDAVLIMMERTP